MKKTLLLLAILFPLVACGQTIGGSVSLGGGVTIGSSGTTPPITGGQLLLPSNTVILNRPPHFFVSKFGAAYFEQTGPASNAETGLWWTPSAAACEAAPSTCPWTLILKATVPTIGGIVMSLNTAIDIDSTHIIMSFGYAAGAVGCRSVDNKLCVIDILDTAANTLTPVTIPSQGAQMLTFIARDSAGICYTSTLYNGSPIWASPDSSCSGTWTKISSGGYSTLPGLSAASGNVYMGVVIGDRIYFGGEGGVLSCNLTFTSCSEDYLPFSYAPGQRNVTTIIGDQDYGSATNPGLLLECCKQDQSVTNYSNVSRYTTATGWVNQVTTANGLPPFMTGDFFNNFAIAQGTGAARRYYMIMGPANGSAPYWTVWASTSSAATSWTAFTSSVLPTPTATYQAKQIANGTTGTRKWIAYTNGADGSAFGVYIVP